MPVFYRGKDRLRRNKGIDLVPQDALEMCMDSDSDLDLELNLLGSDSEAEADSYLDKPGRSDRNPEGSTREPGAKRRWVEVPPPSQDFYLAVCVDDWSMADVEEEPAQPADEKEPVQPGDGDQDGEQDGDAEDSGEDDADVGPLHYKMLRLDAEGPTVFCLHVCVEWTCNRQQRFDEINNDILLGSKHNQTDGAQGVFSLFKNTLLALIFQVSVSSHFARIFHHVVILVILLTEVACSDVHMNCSAHGVSVASINYPNEFIDINAPEGRMILLNFDYVSLGPADSLIISDTIEPVKTQYYEEDDQDFSPFLSRRNQLRITPVLVGSSGRGFNITVSCYEISETNTGRLVDGNTEAEGFLELSTQSESGGEWMRVCEENLSHRVAEIVCGELGYAIVKEVAYDNGECQSGGSGGNCVRAPVCEEYAYRLKDCSPPSTNCTSSKAVKIKCFEPGFIGCYNYGSTQLQKGSIHSSTPDCVSSCRSDKVQALAIVNDSQCFCPTADEISLSDLTTERPCTYPVYNASVGFCNKTDDVMNGSWDSNITWFGSIVHLTCDNGYNLTGSEALQCVPGVSPFLPQWNHGMPTCEKDDSLSDSTQVTVTTSLHTTDQVYSSSGTDGKSEWLFSLLGIAILLGAILICFLCLHKFRSQMAREQRTYHTRRSEETCQTELNCMHQDEIH